jgi:dTDP-glucose 4,6-dehydratase
MRALVTGGAGFLGSHLVDRLVTEGFEEVIALDNLVTGSWENLGHYQDERRVTKLQADVCDPIRVDGPLTWVLHFASPASPVDFTRIPIQVMLAGSYGTHNCLELALQKGASFMMASTSECYGDPLVSPQAETYWGNVNPIGIRGVYDEAKRFSEAMTMAYHRYHGVDTRIARFFNTYGPRMRLDDGRIVPNFITQALEGEPLTVYGDGTQTRSFGYVDDIVEGIWRLMCADFHEPVNIGTEDEHSVLEFAKVVKEVTGSRSQIAFHPALPDDPKQRRPDLTRNRQVLDGWTPQIPLQEGLLRTAEHFQSLLPSRQAHALL